MNRLYRKTDLMILQWVLQEERRHHAMTGKRIARAAQKKIPMYRDSLYRQSMDF